MATPDDTVELRKRIISDVRGTFDGIRGGQIRDGPEIAFTTTDGSRVAQIERGVRQYITEQYDVRVRPSSPSKVTPASGPVAPDFAFEIHPQ